MHKRNTTQKSKQCKIRQNNYPGSVASNDTRPGNETGYNAPEPTQGNMFRQHIRQHVLVSGESSQVTLLRVYWCNERLCIWNRNTRRSTKNIASRRIKRRRLAMNWRKTWVGICYTLDSVCYKFAFSCLVFLTLLQPDWMFTKWTFLMQAFL